MRKLIVYISMSIDGFIAGPDGDLGFLSQVEVAGEDYGYSEFVKTIDAVIIGRKTIEKVESMGYEYPLHDREVYVISRNLRQDKGSMHYYQGNPADLARELKGKPGKNIYCDGGSEIVNQLFKAGEVDDLILSIIPVILGDGIPLFRSGNALQTMHLISCKSYPSGLVQMHYSVPGKSLSISE